MKLKKIGITLASAGLLFGALTACGGYDDSEYSDEPSVSEEVESDNGFFGY